MLERKNNLQGVWLHLDVQVYKSTRCTHQDAAGHTCKHKQKKDSKHPHSQPIKTLNAPTYQPTCMLFTRALTSNEGPPTLWLPVAIKLSSVSFSASAAFMGRPRGSRLFGSAFSPLLLSYRPCGGGSVWGTVVDWLLLLQWKGRLNEEEKSVPDRNCVKERWHVRRCVATIPLKHTPFCPWSQVWSCSAACSCGEEN